MQMITFGIMWLISIVLSIGMEIANAMKIIKIITDEGYKINIEAMRKTNEHLDPVIQKKWKILLFFPFINILLAMKHTIDFNNLGVQIIDALRIAGVLEDMTKEEIESYKENPTLLNSLMTQVNYKNAKFIEIKLNGDTEESIIYYNINPETEDINIIKVNGPASSLTKEEQIKLVMDNYLTKETEEKNIEEIEKQTNDKIENNQIKQSKTDKKIEYLRGLKEKLQEKREDVKKYTKKRK